MAFKANWEKTVLKHKIPQRLIEQMVMLAYPNKKLISHEVIPGGCANLNIKIKLDHKKSPLILRIYLRNPEAVYLEQKLGKLLNKTIPLPQIYYVGDLDGYRFAITEFLPGITLRDLLLSDQSYDMPSIMFKVGQILAKINKQKLPPLFRHNITQDEYLLYAKNTLSNIGNKLSKELITQIYEIFEKNIHLMPVDDEHIMHGDFDPANILVDNINGNWQITGILDWEFASAGPFLWDVANMLGYAHQMPQQFEFSFLDGLKSERVVLPNNWRFSVHMFNLESLLDLLHRTDPKHSPNQYADIAWLINYIIGELT